MTTAPFTSMLRKWRWWIATVLIAALALGYFAVPWVLGPQITPVAVKSGNIVQTLVASGTIANPNRVDISPQIAGSVDKVWVQEGQFVTDGQPLITLDDTELQASMAQATGAVEVANAKLRQIRETALPSAQQSLGQAQATLLQVQLQFDRTSKLHGARIVADVTLDAAVHDLAQANAAVTSAALAVKNLEQDGSDYSSAQSALAQAQSNVRGIQAKMSYTTIAAPSDGTIITRTVEQGNVVQPGKVLLVLSPVGKTEITIQVDEKNIGLIALGQPALVSTDAFPDRTFDAILTYIQPSVDPNRGSVEVKLEVAKPPDFLMQDMTVSVDIETARKNSVLIAQLSSVHDLLTKKPWVLKVDGTSAKRQSITIGARGVTEVEVSSGLALGDLLVPSKFATVTDGKRIRVLNPAVVK
ncbi:MAG: efflux RND transporter periplasmic adaptor subunit [Aestuariivirga sp.]